MQASFWLGRNNDGVTEETRTVVCHSFGFFARKSGEAKTEKTQKNLIV